MDPRVGLHRRKIRTGYLPNTKRGAFAFFGVSSNLTENLEIKHSTITSSSRDSRISRPTTTVQSTTVFLYLCETAARKILFS